MVSSRGTDLDENIMIRLLILIRHETSRLLSSLGQNSTATFCHHTTGQEVDDLSPFLLLLYLLGLSFYGFPFRVYIYSFCHGILCQIRVPFLYSGCSAQQHHESIVPSVDDRKSLSNTQYSSPGLVKLPKPLSSGWQWGVKCRH